MVITMPFKVAPICNNPNSFGLFGHIMIAIHERKLARYFPQAPPVHEIWARVPCIVILHSPDEVWDPLDHISGNPRKQGLATRGCGFVKPYNGGPLDHSRT